jgi:acetyl esterase
VPADDGLADEGLAEWVRQVRASEAPSCESVGVAGLRAAQRARLSTRPAGPAVHHVEDLIASGRIPVRLYRPGPEPRPLVLYAHGGGFVLGDLDSHDSTCRRLAVSADAAVLAVDFRRAPEHPGPAAVDDFCDVFRWAEGNPDRLGTTRQGPAGLAGDSSGGAIVALAAARLTADGAAPSALLLAYPNADLTLSSPSVREKGSGWGLDRRDLAWFVEQWVPDPGRRTDPEVDPLHADLAGLPPTLLATAEHDPLLDEGAALADRMRSAGVAVEHVSGPGLVHGYLGLGHLSPAAARAGEELFARFGRLLRSADELSGRRATP